MSSFGSYDGAQMCPSFIYSKNEEREEDEECLLLDMDSITSRNTYLSGCCGESMRKTCSLGDENEETDGAGWYEKPVEEWCQEETISWLMSAASHLGQPYSSIRHTLAVSGRELVNLTKEEFLSRDPVYGAKLYDLLHMQFSSFGSIHSRSEEELRISNASDAESENSIEVSTKRPPGRPRIQKPRKSATGQGKLWEFIRDLLLNRETCPSLICWEDYSQAKFRFVKSDEVAKKWGSRKGNTKMTYEKLSRAMRYYYKNKIFQPVLGRRLVYQFGPNAKGWQTDNPNFRR